MFRICRRLIAHKNGGASTNEDERASTNEDERASTDEDEKAGFGDRGKEAIDVSGTTVLSPLQDRLR